MLLRKPRCTLCKTLGIIYSLSTAKCIDLPLLIDLQHVFQGGNPILLLLIRSAVRLIEVINNKNLSNTIYFGVRVRLIKVSSE